MCILHGPLTCDKGLLKFKKIEKFKQNFKSLDWFLAFHWYVVNFLNMISSFLMHKSFSKSIIS